MPVVETEQLFHKRGVGGKVVILIAKAIDDILTSGTN